MIVKICFNQLFGICLLVYLCQQYKDTGISTSGPPKQRITQTKPEQGGLRIMRRCVRESSVCLPCENQGGAGSQPPERKRQVWQKRERRVGRQSGRCREERERE
jgi:hypothetical protein